MKTNNLWLLALLLPLPATADLVGRVVAVNAGSSLTVLVNERERIKVRLIGIDAPEPYWEFGKQSQSSLAAYASGKEMRLDDLRRDRRGQTLARGWVAEAGCARVDCPKTLDVGLVQVAAGLAWNDPQYGRELSLTDRQRYAEAEFMAKVRRLGLWSAKDPKVPWSLKQKQLEE